MCVFDAPELRAAQFLKRWSMQVPSIIASMPFQCLCRLPSSTLYNKMKKLGIKRP